METQKRTPAVGGAKKEKRISTRVAIVLTIILILISDAVAGSIGWRMADAAAAKKAEAEKKAYMEQYSVSRSSTYQRLTDSWTKNLSAIYADVAFFGDSITAGGRWEEYYPYLMTVNLGVVGDTNDGLLTRLPQIEALYPPKCFVMIGVNDLINDMAIGDILQRHEQLLKSLSAMSEDFGMQVYVQSVLPVREDVTAYDVRNADIRQLNEGVAVLADKYGITYIDVHSHMADEKGMLKEQYSYDGLHLTGLGYDTWQELLIPYVDE